jgi:hypothetical protein
MKRTAIAVAFGALALPAASSAETFSDPAGDNCGEFGSPGMPLPLCDDDVTSASQDAPSPGTIRVTFNYAAPPKATGYLPRLAIHTASGDRAQPDFLAAYYHVGGGNYAWQMRRWNAHNDGEVTAAVEATTSGNSVSLTFPASAIGSPSEYRWWAAGGAIGEAPHECPEQVPNDGFHTHVLGGGPGGGTPGGGAPGGAAPPSGGRTADAMLASLGTAAKTGDRRTGAAPRLLADGGFRIPLVGLDPGRVTAELTGSTGPAARALVLANGQVLIGQSGRARMQVRLTRAGRRALRGARRTVRARLTLTYRPATGGSPLRVARRLRIAPPPEH